MQEAEENIERLGELRAAAGEIKEAEGEKKKAEADLKNATSKRYEFRSRRPSHSVELTDDRKPLNYTIRCSPISAVTLNDDTKRSAKIPMRSAFFCYAYPLLGSQGWPFFWKEDQDDGMEIVLTVNPLPGRKDAHIIELKHPRGEFVVKGTTDAKLRWQKDDEMQLLWKLKVSVSYSTETQKWIRKLPQTNGETQELKGHVKEVEQFAGGRVQITGIDGTEYTIPNPSMQEPWNVSDPLVSFLTLGGFVYFDYQYEVVGINSIRFKAVNSGDSRDSQSQKQPPPLKKTKTQALLSRIRSREHINQHDIDQGHMAKLFYGRRQTLPSSAYRALDEARRWQPVTLPSLPVRWPLLQAP